MRYITILEALTHAYTDLISSSEIELVGKCEDLIDYYKKQIDAIEEI